MANDGNPGAITGVNPVIGRQASEPTRFQPAGGKSLPQSGKNAVATAAPVPADTALLQSKTPAAKVAPVATSTTATFARTGNANTGSASANEAKTPVASRSDPQTLVNQVNKYLNDSGRPDQFRVDPASTNYIQQVNPTTGAVVAEYSVNEFPALARSVGASGLLIDDLA